MFDPSKLNLDIGNQKNDDNINIKEYFIQTIELASKLESDFLKISKDKIGFLKSEEIVKIKELTPNKFNELKEFLMKTTKMDFDEYDNQTKKFIFRDNKLTFSVKNEQKRLELSIEKMKKELNTKSNIEENKEKTEETSKETNEKQEKIEKNQANQKSKEEKIQEVKIEIAKEEIKEVKQEEKKLQKDIIYDINMGNLDEVINYSLSKEYDYFTIVPDDNKATISFVKDDIKKEDKIIKYHIYSDIKLKAKKITKLKLDETKIAQEGNGEMNIGSRSFKAIMKTSPSNMGERIYFKLKEIDKKAKKKKKEKPSAGKILGYMAAALFSLLIIGGVFLAFTVFNSNTVSDINFFNQVGINTQAIKDFTAMLVNIIFSILLLIETILLFTFIFKAILTKKEYKRKRVIRSVMSIFLIIIALITASIWMLLNEKISSLKGADYGKPVIYDNGKILSGIFNENDYKLNPNESLIGPVSIKFDIESVIKQLKDNNFKPSKIIWLFGEEEEEKPIDNFENIRTFEEKGIQSVKLRVEGKNIANENETVDINIANINIDYILDIEEQIERNGEKTFIIDANSLKGLGKVRWYYMDLSEENINIDIDSPDNIGYKFYSPKPISEDVLMGIIIDNGRDVSKNFDATFVIKGVEKAEINGEIELEKNIRNPLEYTFRVRGAETEFGKGLIEEFKWVINDNKTIYNEADILDIDGSSEIVYEFKKYGEHSIRVEITDSAGNTKILEKDIEIEKQLEFKKGLKIYNDGKIINNIDFEEESRSYYIDNLAIPSKLKIDASGVRSEDFLYSLDKVEWDTDGDGRFDETGKILEKEFPIGGDYKIGIKYTFKNIKKEDTISLEENIYIKAIKKEAIINLDMIYNSDYTPVIVKFDASKSQIKGKDIVKFIYDYGDGVIEERDAKNEGHKYTEPGDYNVKLTVVTSDGSKYTHTEKLVLKPKPQSAKIKVSMKSAPRYQEIDFSSEESEGQIVNYFWDFGDGNTSIEANPSHEYEKAGKYKIKLTLDFRNNNTLSDEIEIKIYEDF